jgi:hypothetical protein
MPGAVVVGLSYLFVRLDLFVVLLVAMSLSFYGHVYIDKQYHVAESWLGRFHGSEESSSSILFTTA